LNNCLVAIFPIEYPI